MKQGRTTSLHYTLGRRVTKGYTENARRFIKSKTLYNQNSWASISWYSI